MKHARRRINQIKCQREEVSLQPADHQKCINQRSNSPSISCRGHERSQILAHSLKTYKKGKKVGGRKQGK